jgi:hypothetical protein
MFYWSQFVTYMTNSKGRIAQSTWEAIRRRGVARLKDRMASGRADDVLLFDDLIHEAENSLLK